MGCGISWQNPDVHSDPFACEPHKPPHWRTDVMCSTGRGINLSADAGANSPARAVDEVAIDAGTMVRILFHNGEITAGRAMPGLAGRDRTVGDNLFADHQISALLGKRNNNMDVVRRSLSKQRLIYLQRFLTVNVCGRAAHLSRLRRRSW